MSMTISQFSHLSKFVQADEYISIKLFLPDTKHSFAVIHVSVESFGLKCGLHDFYNAKK